MPDYFLLASRICERRSFYITVACYASRFSSTAAKVLSGHGFSRAVKLVNQRGFSR